MATGYFARLPTVVYNSRLATSLATVVRKRSSLAVDQQRIFQKYRIEDGDTPEIVAHKLYGEPQYWWVVLLGSDVTRPEQWPVADEVVDAQIARLYGSADRPLPTKLVDDRGEEVPRRIRFEFVDESTGETVTWHERGQGLGALKNGVIKSRGTELRPDDELRALNDGRRDIYVVRRAFLENFVREFIARVNAEVPV